jgi:hypothetical protein
MPVRDLPVIPQIDGSDHWNDTMLVGKSRFTELGPAIIF